MDNSEIKNELKIGFEPVFNSESKILILGSFPSVKSRLEGFYYGNKQNRFWKMLSNAFKVDFALNFSTIEQKTSFLLKHNIALWDVVSTCSIKGSMDNDIKKARPADVPALIKRCKIERIFCNGKTAYALLLKFFPQYESIAHLLPSTSPANASYNEKAWLEAFNTTL